MNQLFKPRRKSVLPAQNRIHKLILRTMKQQDISVPELAQRSGISASVLHNSLFRHFNPTVRTLLSIEKGLKIKIFQ